MKLNLKAILTITLVVVLLITMILFAVAERKIVATSYSSELAGKVGVVEYDEYVNVRSEPNRLSDASVLFTLEKNAEVTFTGNLYEGHDYKGNTSLDNWLEIETNQGTAWINADAFRSTLELDSYDFQPVELDPLPYIVAMAVEILFFVVVMIILNKKVLALKS